MQKLCKNYAKIMQKLCKNCIIMQKLCKNYAKIMQKSIFCAENECYAFLHIFCIFLYFFFEGGGQK